MFFTGFTDEASRDFAQQLAAVRALGWHHLEARCLNSENRNLAELTEAEFEKICDMLAESGVQINCFGSNIANWRRAPRSAEDFAASRAELLAAIPRMRKLNIKLVRGMSFKLTGDERFDAPELEKIIFFKVRELVNICADNGILYGHENCMNYGGQSHVHTLRLLEAVDSPAFTLIFDTGNPVFTFRRIGAEPYGYQSAWEFYRAVRDFISYVHIKDGLMEPDPENPGALRMRYTFAGEGDGAVREIVADLLAHGYDGGFSIEPHVATVFHAGDPTDNSELQARRRMETYLEYGRRFVGLVAEIQRESGGGDI